MVKRRLPIKNSSRKPDRKGRDDPRGEAADGGRSVAAEFLSIFRARFADVESKMRQERTTDQLQLVAATACRTFDETLAAEQTARRRPVSLACQKGCSWCCSVKVTVSVAEVALVAAYIESNLSARERDELVERVRGAYERTKGLTSDQRYSEPCPLLVDGRCSVYAARPLACRGWNSFDEESCRRAIQEPEYDGARVDLFQQQLAGILREATHAGLFKADLNGSVLELIAALRVVLTREDAVSRWLAGHPAFASAYDEEHNVPREACLEMANRLLDPRLVPPVAPAR